VKRAGWLDHPVLSVLIAVVWLLLQGSLDLVHWLVAAAMGLAIPRLISGFLGPGTRIRSMRASVRLLLVVLWDIVVANLTVARIVLNPWSDPRPGWIRVPLELQHPTGTMLLASIITTTPGTVSCVIDENRREIIVHALDCHDAEATAAQIKARYERLLKEIFE
jgi:multicomponent K+:H+ antiporter subunit E